jgi:probable HAF family extracellular repeat protein
MLRTSLSTLTALLTSAVVLAAPPIYSIEEIGPLPGKEVGLYHPIDINDAGDVLASAEPSGATGIRFFPFIVSATGVTQELDFSDATQSPQVSALNNNGVVVGNFFNGHGFKYESGGWELIPGLDSGTPYNYSYATDINDDGTIVGYASAMVAGQRHSAYRIRTGNLEFLGVLGTTGGNAWSEAYAVNASDHVTGTSSYDYPEPNHTPEHGFIYTNRMQEIPTPGNSGSQDGGDSSGNAINDSGAVVGWFARGHTGLNWTRGFLYESKNFYDLGVLEEPSGPVSLAYDINNAGVIVGYNDGDGPVYDLAFVYIDGTKHRLEDLVSNMGDWLSLDAAVAINESGQIVGGGKLDDGSGGYVKRVFRLTPLADTATLPIDIDIQPNDDNNYVETEGQFSDKMHVSILGSNVLDAGQIDAATVRFGPAAAAPHVLPGTIVDTNEDGYNDLKLRFRTGATGIVCEQIDAPVLTGEIFAGELITGTDSVTTPDCPTAGCHP